MRVRSLHRGHARAKPISILACAAALLMHGCLHGTEDPSARAGETGTAARSVWGGPVTRGQENRVLAALHPRLPDGCEIDSVVRGKALPGWRSLSPVATVVTIVDRAGNPAAPEKISELWLLPMDWIGVKIPGAPHHDAWVTAGGFSTTGEVKVYGFGFARKPRKWRGDVWATAAALDSDDNLSAAEEVFAGRQDELDDEIRQLIRDMPPKHYWAVFDSFLDLGIPARTFFLEHWKTWRYDYGRARVVRLLARMGGAEVDDVLGDALTDPSPVVRCDALYALRHLDSASRISHFGTVRALAHDPTARVRLSVAGALAYFPLEEARPLLIELLRDHDPDEDLRWLVHCSALASLRKLKAIGYGRELVPLLERKASWGLHEVFEALGEVGKREQVPELLQFALDAGVLNVGENDGKLNPGPGMPWGAIEAAYRIAGVKGGVHEGKRLGILTIKRRFGVGEIVHVFHVAETVSEDAEQLLAGPLPCADYIDGRQVGKREELLDYTGPVRRGPGIAANYAVTSHSFSRPGRHVIQWREGKLASNSIEIYVVAARARE